ncbi:MAG TPA: hypothetical protein VNU22_06480 [Candidatus Acidoferrum sp.]|nr:hypothetical protein [Candidatus Acidoferrum sp.]
MRTSRIVAFALVIAAAGCSHGPSARNAATTASVPSAAPVYPGAGAVSGSAYSTSDSFDTVYAFYNKSLPAGSERSHITAPRETAVFLVGNGNDRLSVTVTKSPICCRTLIVFALVKA